MKRTWPLLALAACVDAGPPPTSEPAIVARVVHKELAVARPRRFDLLFVIDSSPGIAPHRARLLSSYGPMMELISRAGSEPLSLHVGVTTASMCDGAGGWLVRAGAVRGSFIIDDSRPDGARSRNYAGTLASAFHDLADTGASGCAAVEPLAAMRAVLADLSSGFVREDAQLAVVFISASDDASPLAVDDYVSWLAAIHPDPGDTWVAGVIGQRTDACAYAGATAAPAPRLFAVLDRFPDRSAFTTICQATTLDALVPLFASLGPSSVGDPCFEAPVAEPIDCAVWYAAPGYERVLERCGPTAPPQRPCWRIVEDRLRCPPDPSVASTSSQRLEVKPGASYPPDHTRIAADCVAE